MNRDSTTTDNDGKYQVSDRDGFPADQLFTIKFHDTDGPLNGEYENLDTVVQFKDPKFTNGDGHWYQGETTKDFNVTLNKKK